MARNSSSDEDEGRCDIRKEQPSVPGELVSGRVCMVPKVSRTKCHNQDCETRFLLRRPHNCRRCGEVFCRPCLHYARRLNSDGEFDEQSDLKKVCFQCYNERLEEGEGAIRSRIEEYRSARKLVLAEKVTTTCEVSMEKRSLSIVPAFWKDQFQVDYTKECRRLLSGFKAEVGSSETSRILCEFRAGYIKVPAWQKSTFWRIEKVHKNCRQCCSKIKSVLNNCRVCGISLCKKCSQRSLLVFFDDDDRYQTNSAPRLAVIKVVGCPEKEPVISLLLPVCKECLTEVNRRQVADRAWYLERPKPVNIITMIVEMEEQFRALQTQIEAKIRKLQRQSQRPNPRASRIVRSLTDQADGRSHAMATLTAELTEHLASMMSMFSRLESIEKHNKINGAKLSLLKNCIKARKDYYWNTKRRIALLADETLVTAKRDTSLSPYC